MTQSEPAPAAEPESEAGAESTIQPAELTEEVILNAAVAFAGHVATAAVEAAAQGDTMESSLRNAVARQYLLETATLCLRRLGESYTEAAGDPALAEMADLLRDGASRAAQASGHAEALSDLGLDLLDRLLG